MRLYHGGKYGVLLKLSRFSHVLAYCLLVLVACIIILIIHILFHQNVNPSSLFYPVPCMFEFCFLLFRLIFPPFSWLNQVHCDATIAFPFLVAETFAKKVIKTTA